MKTLINLTPHAVSIHDADGNLIVTVEPAGVPARCSTQREQVGEFDDIPLYRTRYGEVTGLPDPEPGTILIVSGMVRAAVAHRTDLWQPGEAVRDAAGQVIGCIGLSQ